MLHNPSNLYSGGSVTLDSTPYMRLAAQQRFKQQAIGEAAYRHYSELPDKLNSAGVRLQDWEDPNGNGGIGNDIENTKRFFLENSKDIIKGGAASIKYSRMMQNNSRQIAASKSEGKFQLDTGKSFFDGKHRYRENDLKVKDAVDKSIYDPNHYKDPESKLPFSYSDYSVAAAPYTSQVEMSHNKNITNGIEPDKNPNDKGVYDDVAKKVTYEYGYTPEKLKQIGLNASIDAANNTTIGNKYEDMLGTPSDIQRATDAGKLVYGNDFIADTKEKMAAGTKISEYSQMKIPKTFTDVKSLQDWKDKDREDRQTFQEKQKALDRASKEKNAKVLAGKYGITDPYQELVNNTIKLPITVSDYNPNSPYSVLSDKDTTENFSPFTGMSEQEIQDIAGPKDKYGVRKIKTSTRDINGVEVEGFRQTKDGVVLDDDGTPLDRMQPLRNKATRLGPTLKQQSKGTLEVLPSATTKPKSASGAFDNL